MGIKRKRQKKHGETLFQGNHETQEKPQQNKGEDLRGIRNQLC